MRFLLMSRLSIWMIRLYQKIPGPWHGMCRFTPTCSEYAIDAIREYGFFKGWGYAIRRIFRCNPFGGSGYDPVPKKK